MAEPGQGKDGGGDASKGKQPVAVIPKPELTPNTSVVRQALLSIANLHHSNNPVSNAGIHNIHLLSDTFLVPVRNPVPFWTVCNACKSLVKCEMICETNHATCDHNDFTRLNSKRADLPDFYRAINFFVWEHLCSLHQDANRNPFNNESHVTTALNSPIFTYGSLAGLGSSNSSSSNCPPFSNPGQTPENFGPLPSLKEIYDRAVADEKYFYQTLKCVTNSEGRKLLIPTIGRNQLNLHKIFVEVTARGGIQKVMEKNRLMKEVCASLPQKIDEDYLFATYMALLDSYEYIFFRIPDENHICGSLPLDSSLRPMQQAAGTGESSMQVQDNVPLHGNWGSAGVGFIPHVITVKAGEDVTSKIMAFSQHGPRAVFILSANGAISNVTLRQPTTFGGIVCYEGQFEILSLSGSFLLSENDGQRSRTKGLSVSLSGREGRVLGGAVAGLLMAASPVQVVVGSFIADGGKEPKSAYQMEPVSAPPKLAPGQGRTHL